MTLQSGLRLVRGDFTPFFLPEASVGRRPAHDRAGSGEDLEGGEERLLGSIRALFGPKRVVLVTNSGRTALWLALEAAKLPKGSEVILPSYLCGAVASAVLAAGLRPVVADIDDDLNLAYASVRQAATIRTKALIVAHLGGKWAQDLPLLSRWAAEHGILLIEDAAQALGLRNNGTLAGTGGAAGILSFGPGKSIHGPGGGALVLNEPDLAARAETLHLPKEPLARVRRRIKAFARRFPPAPIRASRRVLADALRARLRGTVGLARRPRRLEPASFPRYRISEAEAFIASAGFEGHDAKIDARRAVASRWATQLARLPAGLVKLPSPKHNVFEKLPIRLQTHAAELHASSLKACLFAAGVQTEAPYRPLHLRTDLCVLHPVRTPVVEAVWAAAFNLPVRPNLGPDDWVRIQRGLSAFELSHRGS